MPRLLVGAFALVLLFVGLAGAQDRRKPVRHPARRVEQTILQLERETMAAIKNGDASALSRILADDFIFRSPAGPDLNRAEFLNLVKSFPVKVLAVWGEGLKVHVYGQTAVLTGVQRSRTASADGKEETSAGAFTDIFIRRKGRWLLVLAHSVEIKAASPTVREGVRFALSSALSSAPSLTVGLLPFLLFLTHYRSGLILTHPLLA